MSKLSDQVIFIAKRHIAAGEEVTDCYGIHHLSMSRSERLAALVCGNFLLFLKSGL